MGSVKRACMQARCSCECSSDIAVGKCRRSGHKRLFTETFIGDNQTGVFLNFLITTVLYFVICVF